MDAPHIWVPKFKIFEAQIATPIGGAQGFFTIEACNRYGHVQRSLGPWRQVITDAQMDDLFHMLTVGGGRRYAAVGTASPTFTTGSTGLGSFLARTNTTYGSSDSADTTGVDNYREVQTVTRAFGLGAVVGNLTEIGMFSAADNVSARFVDLIRTSGGVATTFPVTASDQLRVTHTLYRYPSLATHSGSFTIGGAAGSGVHDYTMNMSSLGSASVTGNGNGGTMGLGNGTSEPWDCFAYRDATALGSLTDISPTGAVFLNAQSSYSGEANGTASNDGTTWYRTKEFTYSLTTANHASGINCIGFGNMGASIRKYKALITPAIPKYAGSVQRILTLECSVGIRRV